MLDEKNLSLLIYLAKKTSLTNSLKTSTSRIASDLALSQQSISRKLNSLTRQKLINSFVAPSGYTISLSRKGIVLLKERHSELDSLFKGKKPLEKKLLGTVKKGVGDGKYYTSLTLYKKQFQEKLGMDVFPGTLNLKVDEIELDSFLSQARFIPIDGFPTKERNFGSGKAVKVKVNGKLPSAIFFPERSIYGKEIIELISSIQLKKSLGLKEGGKLSLTLD
ncbi:MAG: DUF120 domain-containing protein [archaeon]